MMTISENDNVVTLTEAEFSEAIDAALEDAGCSLEELQAQAAEGSFANEQARRTWFAIAAFID